MATTSIEDGRIIRRTKAMKSAHALAFAKALESNPNRPAQDITVVPCGNNRARVEFTPTRAETMERHFREQMEAREKRAQDVRHYKWRRIGRRAWHCQGPEPHQQYTVFLSPVGGRMPHCTCPDWTRISSIGGKCKHFICAEEAERCYERDHPKVAPAPVPDIPLYPDPEPEDPFQVI